MTAMEKKDKTLNVPNLRFPEFSGEWERCTLGDFGNVITGNTPPTAEYENFDNGTHLWASPADLGTTKYIESTQTLLSDRGFEKSRSFPANSILVTCIGSTIGKMGMSKTEMASNQQINTIVPVQHDANFVYYAVQSRFPRYLSSIAVQAVPILSKSSFEKLTNYTTARKEQIKIGNLLSLIDERIDTQKKIIEDLKKLKDAIRTKLFTSLESHCNEYDEIRNMLHYEQPSAYLVNSTEYSEDYPTPVLTANKAFILGYTDEEQGVYDKGDCIIFDDFTMDLKYVTFPFKVKSSAIKILTPRQNIDLYFIYEYLLYLGLVSEEHKRHYISEIESMNIIHPQLKEQRQISQALRSLEMQVGNAIALQKLLAKQKQYLLTQMFI